MISRGSPDITSRPYYNQNKPLLGSFSLMLEVRVCLRAEHIYRVAATYPPPRSLAVRRRDVATLKRRQCCFPSSRIIYFYSEKEGTQWTRSTLHGFWVRFRWRQMFLAACSLEHSPAPTWTQPEHPAGDESVFVWGGGQDTIKRMWVAFFFFSVINQSGVVPQWSSCDPDVTLTLSHPQQRP